MSGRVSLFRWEDLPLEKVTDMVARKTIASPRATVTQVYYKKGAQVPLHVHGSDILIYVLQGAVRTQVDGQDLTVREGEVLTIGAGAAHQAESLDDTFVVTFVADTRD
jgi:quercetin dioxygenase-like cupin family protein